MQTSAQASPSPGRPSFAPDLTLYGNERWYVAYTQPRRELGAQAQLGNQGFRTFLPQYEKTTRHARKLMRAMTPLFPRYMFLVLDLDRDPWHSANWSYGVSGLVMARDRPLPVTKGVVEALIGLSLESAGFRSRDDLRTGQTVRMIAGPFAEQLGVLEHLGDHDRVRVLLQMMGGEVPIRMSRDDIKPLN